MDLTDGPAGAFRQKLTIMNNSFYNNYLYG
jgi:hypothetical protein